MNLDRDPYEGLGTPDRDPYEGLGTAVDPYEGLGTPEPSQNYFADKARRLGHDIPKAIGNIVASPGSAVQSGAELAAEALRWRAVRSGDLTEAEAAAKKKEFLDRAALTAPMQAAQAARDVGADLTAVGPRHFAKPDPARNEEIGSAVASGVASLLPIFAASRLSTVAGMAAGGGYMGESQRQDAVEKGATPTEQAATFALSAPIGAASELALGVPALLKSVRAAKPAVSKIERGLDAGLEKLLGKIAPAAVPVVQQSVKAALREGVQEGLLEQPAQNIIAKDIVGYDPTRDRSEGMGMAALAGSIVGGGVGAAAQLGQELDTRQNLAESKKTLLAQQQKLVRGLNAAQMFPVNAEGKVTNELPLPPEMSRLATDRGVFHFNPALIDEATLLKLSGAGRENTPLGLGSQSKADVAARVAQGDPAVAVTERTPDGTEVKAAVATVGTAAQTAAQLDASKTDGHTVQVESLGQVLGERAKAAPNFIEAMLAADAAATTATREAAAKEDAARAARQTELAEKKARFEERLAVARQTLADPAASFPAVDGALTSLTSYAEDASLGLTQTQREQALKAQAALQKRHTQLAPAAAAQADTAAATRRAEAQLAADAKTAKVRAERAALQHLETTGRDLATGEITDLTNVPDEELATLDANAEGLTPQQIDAEQQRRGEAAERAAAQQNEAGYTLRDLILGKKPALAAAGQSSALRLKSPAALSLEGGTMAGEHRALGERQGGFKIFSDTGLAEDGLQERLQSLGFAAPDVTTAYALYERALGGEEIRPERGGEQQVDFAQRPDEKPGMASGDGAAPQSNGSPQSGPDSANARYSNEQIQRRKLAQITLEKKGYRIDAQNGEIGTFWRNGPPPEGGLSYNFKDKFYEKGVSVYPRAKATTFAGMTARDWYRITGKVVGRGSDGEPLVEVLRSLKLTPKQLAADQALFDAKYPFPKLYVGDLIEQNMPDGSVRNVLIDKVESYGVASGRSLYQVASAPSDVKREHVFADDGHISVIGSVHDIDTTKLGVWKVLAEDYLNPIRTEYDKTISPNPSRGGSAAQFATQTPNPGVDAAYDRPYPERDEKGRQVQEVGPQSSPAQPNLPRDTGNVRGDAAPAPAPAQGPAGRAGRGVKYTHTVAPGTPATAAQLRARPMAEIEDSFRRNGVARDRAYAMLEGYYARALGSKTIFHSAYESPIKSDADEQKLIAAINTYDAGGKFVWPSEQLKNAAFVHYATAPRPIPPTPRPILTDTQVAEQLAALRREFPALTRDLDLRSGLVADELRAAGYRGPVPPGVQAAILKLKAEKRLLVIATNAAREGNGGGLFLHEMAHPFFDALPPETQTILRELHAQEMATQTGPLFDAQGNLTTDVFVRAADFPPARLRADPDLPVKEWFAERVRALNADWLAGRTPRDHSTLVRVWRELLAKLREIFAQVRGLDPDADLFTTTFRRWLNAGARANSTDVALTHAGLAYATRQKADFASYQDTMDLGSTPLGLTLPNEIRNLAPRWQDKTLQFESSLDKALYYAGGTPGELRTKIIDSLAEQTQLSPGEIATLARDLRQKLAPLARPTPSNGTVRVPAQMQSDAAKLTGTNFATGAAVPAWPENFPNVIVMTTVPNLYNQGGYEAAKAGNAEAARDVVLAAARENKFFDLQKRFPGAILVPVRALEKAGNNRLPGEFAHYFGHVTGLRVDEEIVQTNQTGHTGSGSDYRMAHRPTFDGAVIPGQTYIIVDDVVTMGGTLGELRAHITSQGGIVGAITTLAAAQFSAQIALTPKTKLALETQFNQRALSEWLKQQRIYGGTIGALTEAEGRWLLAAKTLDAAGNRLAAQRRQGDGSGVAPSVGAPAPTAGLSVDFASQASEYVAANGTPPAKVAAARADIEHLLDVVHDEQLELISYDAGGPVPRGLPAPVNVGDATRALRHRAAEALKAPTQPDVVRAAYGIDPRDPDYKGGERISSIIPALVADPKRAWDIRGAQIDTARDLMTLVSVLRSPYVETAKIILLNRDGAVVHSEIVAVGSLTAAIMDLTQLSGVLNRAPQTAEGYDVIFSHNHPGGNPQPGEADYLVTRRLRGLLDRTKHNLRDHIVTNGDTYFSYAENNWPVYQDKYARPSPPWAPTKTPSPVTAQPPAARGADADTHVQPGTQAPWEIVRRNELLSTATRETTQELIASLRQVDPTALHIIYLNRRNLVTALERVPNFKAAAPTKAGWQPWEPLTTKLLEGFGREAAASFMLVAPDTMTRREATQFMRDMSEMAEISGYTFIDFSAKQFTLDKTARSLGLMEPGVDFATGPQTETPEFKTWFGDSKVVDANGNPTVVYHGTSSDFNEFKLSRSGEFGPGAYFTTSPNEAGAYTRTNTNGANAGLNIVPVFLKIENPFVVKKDASEFWNAFPADSDAESVANAKKAGYDGIAFARSVNDVRPNGKIFDTGEKQVHYVVFSPTQIKSATGNRGTFDPTDARIDFATGNTPQNLAEIEQRLAALRNSQEDPAELEKRGRALTAERDQLKREIADETRTDQAAKATIDVRHPAAVAIPSEPGDAWAMAPKMTDGEITAELDGIRNYLHAQGDGLAPAMRAHLAARLNALAAQQHARGTPAATVTPIPKIDRRAALVAELTRGRALAADGNRTGNDAALNEGNRLVKLATRALDEEFPGWDAAKPGGQKTEDRGQKTEDSRDQTPPPPAAEGDGEQSPFSGAEEDTMPVRPGKWSEVYGHSAYTPSFLLKTWRRIRAVLTGIRGPIPELPTFPAARWNKTDTFIAEHGPQFYARISEGERALKSANDYLQRTAQDQIGAIIEPLLKAEGTFRAEDYAQLRKYQEQARRTQAEGKPLPRSLTAGIAALNSQMESSPYVLFNRLVFALDLHWRATNLKDSAGNAITLPAGLNAAETKAEVSRLGTLLAASPHAALLQKAVEQHRALVKQVAEDLKSRELLAADHLANPYYFPHLTLEKQGPDNKIEQRELSPARVRPGTEADFRGYLETPVGSKKAIEQDYVRAMYYHLVQVGAHNFKADAVRDYFRPYDIKTTVEARAKELTKERGQPVTWEQAFNEEFAPRGYVKYGTDSRDAFPTLTINRDLLARRLGVMLTSGDLHAQLKALHQTGVKLLPEDIRESLTQGERETWIVPSRVAEALRGIGDRLSAQDNAVEAAAKWTLGVWKGWKLFMPMSHVRYEYGNVVADTEKLLSSSPGTFKYLPRAAKELRAFWQGGPPSADLQAALKEGVINAITAQEMDSLTRQKAFEAFETRSQKAWDIVKRRGSSILYQPATALLGLGDFSTPELSALREAITRYAHYQGNLEALRAGARPAYGGAYWKNIEAMTDSRPGANDAAVRKAAAISKATFGDYGDLSVLGQHARDQFIPFYSWMEINFRYHANLLRNLRDMVREGEGPAAAQAGKAVALAGASFTARAAGGIALRLALPYLALALWNNSGDRDELEKLLSEEDRRRTHLILGRDAQGKVNVVYGNTALMDVMKWVSGPKFAQAMGGWLHGKTDFTTAAAAWRDAILPDLANNSVGSFGPYFKIPYTLASGKAVFPDVTDQRTVPSYDMRRHIVGQLTDEFTADLIERTVNKDYYGSKDLGGWAKQLILQVRQRDPESWAFYAIKDKANDYLEKRTGTKRDSSVDAPDQQVLRNFRRAIYRGDADKAVQFYQRLLDYGYTAERFQASIRSQDPLSALPKENGLRKQFVESLSPDDRAQLDRAYVFYQRMNASRGQERQLFPSQSSGINGQMRYQAQPRTEALRAQMQRVDGMSDEEREQRAQRDERRSLQRTR